MKIHLPHDISAESVASLLASYNTEVEFCGPHKRNAYVDILDAENEEGTIHLKVARPGLYHILPEALFHPVDRFEGIRAVEYKERMEEEIEKQKKEEEEAKLYFRPFDRFIFTMGTLLDRMKNEMSGSKLISSLIADKDGDKAWKPGNRFVSRMIVYLPHCRRLRGNMDVLSLILRKVLLDEGIKVALCRRELEHTDLAPRYGCTLEDDRVLGDTFLGNSYPEEVLRCDLPYWNDEECLEDFNLFVEEMKEFEAFLNYYFMGIETVLEFDISTESMRVVLGLEPSGFLGYNTVLE